MKLLALTFLSILFYQQELPFAEFYNGNTKIDFNQPLRIGDSITVDVRIKHGNQEINCSIRRGTVSLIRGDSSLQSEVITLGHSFSLSTLLTQAKPGDKLIFSLTDVWDNGKNKSISLDEYIFSLELK